MLYWTLLLTLLSISVGDEVKIANPKNIWAVLIAFGWGYEGYTDQATVCFLQHELLRNGVPPEQIITVSHNDAADSPYNVYGKGKLFNEYSLLDVMKGCKVDYTGSNVSQSTVMNIFGGYAQPGWKTLNSGHNDNVLVWMSGTKRDAMRFKD